MKTCTDCQTTYDAASWSQLPLVGYYDDDALDDEHPATTTLELRSCPCGAALSVERPKGRPYAIPPLAHLVASDPRVRAILVEGCT